MICYRTGHLYPSPYLVKVLIIVDINNLNLAPTDQPAGNFSLNSTPGLTGRHRTTAVTCQASYIDDTGLLII